MTRTGRNSMRSQMERNLIDLKEGLIDSGVIEIAVNMHAALDSISNKFSKEAVIDIIPQVVTLLNKYDAAIKVNEDLKAFLENTTAENNSLRKLLAQEKKSRVNELNDSLCNEERADAEIDQLKIKLEALKTTADELK
ncbi:hypothetical protein LSTR_LSTR015195, partial [Laodelphax striatellus]